MIPSPFPRALVRAVAAIAGSAAIALFAASSTIAHPLGNFTINHFAGIVVGVDKIDLDVVLDLAEIPTVQERQRLDGDGNGLVTDAEIETERLAQCDRRATDLVLIVAGQPARLEVTASGLSFPSGAAGLSTMRVVCEYQAGILGGLDRPTEITFQDTSFAERIGWREIVVQGDGVTISGPAPAAASISQRLTTYPQDRLSLPLDERSVAFTAEAGGPRLPPTTFADAMPLSPQGPSATAGPGAVPGGIGTELSGLLGTADLTPPVVILSLLAAVALGAGHALTPGHGKTIMAAYLVGTRGTARHALALGATVTISHTLGVLGLAAVILAFGSVAPEQLNRSLAVISGLLVSGIGVYLLGQQIRERQRGRTTPAHPDHAPSGHGHSHGPFGSHSHDPHSHAADIRFIPSRHAQTAADMEAAKAPGKGVPLSWRSLVGLGLFGGFVPSINALIILLSTVAVGRAAYGLVLVVAFGIGMALVLGGIGLGLVFAARWMSRTSGHAWLRRAIASAPLVTAIVILALGVYLTGQAIGGRPAL